MRSFRKVASLDVPWGVDALDKVLMDPLLRAAARLSSQLGLGDRLRLVGGLAVRLQVGSGARVTGDVDLVAMDSAAREAVLRHLAWSGFTVGEMVGWWRAVRGGKDALIVDVSPHPVVDVSTFDSIALHGEPQCVAVGGSPVWVVERNDLALLKVLACRGQDLVDLVLLSAHAPPDAAEMARRAALEDLERAVARGANRARHALRTGDLAEVFEESMGRGLDATEREAAARLLGALEAKGL